MKCKNCGTQLTKEIKFCPRCGAPNEKKGMSKPLLITLICLTAVVVSLAVTFVTLMLRNKSGNPGTFDFTCSQYTEEMNRILGEKKLDQDKWVINDTSAVYTASGFEIDLGVDKESKHVDKISVGPADSEDAVKVAAVSIMVTETELTQKDALNQLADLKEKKQEKIENDNSTVTVDGDKNRFVIEPRPDKEEKTAAPATQAQPTTVQPTTETPTESPTEADWKALYKKAIEDDPTANDKTTYALADIDGDGTPELIINPDILMKSKTMYWVKDGEIQQFGIGRGMTKDSFRYNPETGDCWYSVTSTGMHYYALTFKNKEVTEGHTANQFTTINEYRVDDKTVDKAAYDAMAQQITSTASELPTYKSRSQIISDIDKY